MKEAYRDNPHTSIGGNAGGAGRDRDHDQNRKVIEWLKKQLLKT